MHRKPTHNLHDGQLETFSIGPKNELNLSILLVPAWNRGGPEKSRIRFSAISNMEEVKKFFDYYSINERQGEFHDEVIGLLSEKKGVWRLDLADAGSLEIHSYHFTEL